MSEQPTETQPDGEAYDVGFDDVEPDFDAEETDYAVDETEEVD